MKMPCNIIRDLLPLYADEACSEESREAVEEHLQECPDCTNLLGQLKNSELEDGLKSEKNAVIEYGMKQFKKRSATVGGAMSSAFMVPILICLIINLTTGAGLGWFFILLAVLAVAASLILVPIFVPEDKAFWMFCAFTSSLQVLLAVTCLVSRGNWFWIASSASLFGLSAVFLPFAIRARPLKKWVEGKRKSLIVITVDLVLFLNMMSAINVSRNLGKNGLMLGIGCLAGLAVAALEVYKKKH